MDIWINCGKKYRNLSFTPENKMGNLRKKVVTF